METSIKPKYTVVKEETKDKKKEKKVFYWSTMKQVKMNALTSPRGAYPRVLNFTKKKKNWLFTHWFYNIFVYFSFWWLLPINISHLSFSFLINFFRMMTMKRQKCCLPLLTHTRILMTKSVHETLFTTWCMTVDMYMKSKKNYHSIDTQIQCL